MKELDILKRRLSDHKRKMREYPAETEVERTADELKGRILQVRIEAEELRKSLRLSLPFCESYVEDSPVGPVYKFTYGWDEVRDEYMTAIARNERKRIDQLNARIKKSYEQPATTAEN